MRAGVPVCSLTVGTCGSLLAAAPLCRSGEWREGPWEGEPDDGEAGESGPLSLGRATHGLAEGCVDVLRHLRHDELKGRAADAAARHVSPICEL